MVKPETRKPAERSDSKYKGVRKRKWGKYVSEIRLPNSRERIWLGSYDSAEKAARAFDAALFCLRGRTAKFNFPNNPPDIVGGTSLTPSEIQVAAARFANSEPQNTSHSDHSSSSSSSSSSLLSELHVESPWPSVSDGVARWPQLGNETSFVNLFATMGSENNLAGFELFPGFDDFSNEYFVPPLPSRLEEEEEDDNGDNIDSFLWNF